MGYLKKKVKDERGVWVPVYANTPEELEAKVAARLVQIEEAKALAANLYVYQVAADWYATTTHRSFKRREDYRNAINRHICPVIGQMHISEVTAADVASVMAAADGTAAACRTRSPARSGRCSPTPKRGIYSGEPVRQAEGRR
ncbi:MAG: phage integrase central domain-containing protein [Oscillospiraceae bacterium]